jgi:hypothetical protein
LNARQTSKKQYNNLYKMGHTNRSQRMVVEGILHELNDYGKSLREEDKEAFRRVAAKAMLHFGSISYSCSYNTWALVLFSMILEQEKELIDLRK